MPWISKKKLKKMLDLNAALEQAHTQIGQHLTNAEQMVQVLQKRAYLIGIERVGRVNKFTFVRGQETHQIETYSTMSDDLPQWKEDLLR